MNTSIFNKNLLVFGVGWLIILCAIFGGLYFLNTNQILVNQKGLEWQDLTNQKEADWEDLTNQKKEESEDLINKKIVEWPDLTNQKVVSEDDIDLNAIKEKIKNENAPSAAEPKRLGYCYAYKMMVNEKTKLSNSTYDMDNVDDLNKCADKCKTVIGDQDRYMCTIDGYEPPNYTQTINVNFSKIVPGGNRVTPIQWIQNKEMEIIWVYKGKWFESHWVISTPGKINVKVSKNLWVLVLSAYEYTEWNLEIPDGITVERIITNGYYNQTIKGNKKIPVTEISVENGNVTNDNANDPNTDWLGVLLSDKPDCITVKIKVYEDLTPEILAKWSSYERKVVGEQEIKDCQKFSYPNAVTILKRLTWLQVTGFQWASTGEYFEVK